MGYDEIEEQRNSIEKELDVVGGNAEKAAIKTIELIHLHNEDRPKFQGMVQDVQKLLKWKNDLEKEKLEEKVENYVKTETIEEENDNEDTTMESEYKIEADIANDNKLEIEMEADVNNEI